MNPSLIAMIRRIVNKNMIEGFVIELLNNYRYIIFSEKADASAILRKKGDQGVMVTGPLE